MKAKPRRLIPQKYAARPELVLLKLISW